MVTFQSLQEKFAEKAAAIESIVAGVNEEKAKQAPAEGEWCIREVLTHLSGDVDETFLQGIKRFKNENTPSLDLTPGTLSSSAEREKMPVRDLASSVAQQYREIGAFVGGLNDEQLNLPGKIGFLKQYTGSEDITLGSWATLMADMHLQQHVEQLRALAK
jgi:uncharacterized damage-inducible protein DinB